MRLFSVLLLAVLLAGCASSPFLDEFYSTRSECRKIGGHVFIITPDGEFKRSGVPEEQDKYYCRLGGSNIIF